MAGKNTRGRQKIKIEKISKESNLLVTFSKRRTGLFKKANELSTLCGAELAIIVFSPGNKAFSFGHPNVNTLINRYLSDKSDLRTSSQLELVEEGRSVKELNEELMETNEQIEVEKKRVDELKMRKASESKKRHWWKKPVDELSLQELELLKKAMEKLKKDVRKQYSEEIEVAEAMVELKNNVRVQSENMVVAGVGGSSSSSMGTRGGGHFGHNNAGNFVEGSSSSSSLLPRGTL